MCETQQEKLERLRREVAALEQVIAAGRRREEQEADLKHVAKVAGDFLNKYYPDEPDKLLIRVYKDYSGSVRTSWNGGEELAAFSRPSKLLGDGGWLIRITK